MKLGIVRHYRGASILLAALFIANSPASSQQKGTVTVRDCVTVRDLQHDDSTFRSTIKISPDGSQVAYPVRSPNLDTNENEVELYVRKLADDTKNPGKPILVGDISAVRWRPDSRSLTMLLKENGRRVIEEVDSQTGDRRLLIQANKDITEYSIDWNGNEVVYATVEAADQEERPSTEIIAKGYRIPFKKPTNTLWMREKLFVTRRIAGGWSTPRPITVSSPLSKQPLTELAYGNAPDLNPALSPDGKTLLVSYFDFSTDMPEDWRNSGAMEYRRSTGAVQAFHLLILYDLITGETRVPLSTPWVFYAPLWRSDSKSFVVAAQPPVGSELERENVRTHLVGHSAGAHLFRVVPDTGRIEDVASKLAFPWEGALHWDANGDLLVRIDSMDRITRFSRDHDGWHSVSSFQIPLQIRDQVATNGEYVIADFSDTTTPPQLFLHRPGHESVQVFARLNPQFENLTLARPQEVHWKTSAGFNASGLLLLPPNYVEGQRYPLVIQTKPFTNSFVCGFGNFPSFAPQPLANAGIMYLGQIETKNSTQRLEDYFPKGYPGHLGVGGIAEAAFAMDLWDHAVEALEQQGLVDGNKVGIIGFSRTGWYTEFILSHSSINYRAATVADNVQYSLGEYWLSHDTNTIRSFDQTYGGPPYGATLRNWIANSVSFNLDKFHTPLLMEQMGYGRRYDNAWAPPENLAVSFEVFTGLNRLNKPVELYYYPDEDHTPDHPQALLSSMQRNVDWYRFWLQDYERPNVEDTEQYVRWRKLRKLQQEDGKVPAQEQPAGDSGSR